MQCFGITGVVGCAEDVETLSPDDAGIVLQLAVHGNPSIFVLGLVVVESVSVALQRHRRLVRNMADARLAAEVVA